MLKIAKVGFYGAMMFMIISFIINYGFTDWAEVGEEFDNSIVTIVDATKCEIKYDYEYYNETRNFYYYGLCIEEEFIITVINNTVGKTIW